MPTVYIRFAARGSGPLQRAPVLEKLIAGASAVIPVVNWREEAFRVLAGDGVPMPAVAQAVLRAPLGSPAGSGTVDGADASGRADAVRAINAAEAGDGAAAGHGTAAVRGAWVCVATPVHLAAGMTSVTMPEDGVLELNPTEAAVLCGDFNHVFGGVGVSAHARGAVLLCVFDRALEVTTYEPESAAGRDVFDFQPAGTDASRLRQLMSEIEMWLFDHAVNRARATRSLPSITGLWLWGGGSATAALPRVNGWAAGQDLLFSAFGHVPSFPDGEGAGVVVSAHRPGGAAWLDVETRWLVPAMAALRARRIDRLELSAGDRRFTVSKGFNWHFWHRPRPWWESYGIQ